MNVPRIWIAVLCAILPTGLILHGQSVYEPYAFTHFAGLDGSLGSDDGVGMAAHFSAPQGVVVDGNGNVYIADTGNNTIRKIFPNGTVTTFAGLAGTAGSTDGTGSSARFELPQGVAVDGFANVYVGDSGNNTIRKITPAGVVTTLAGSVHQVGSGDGPGASARFYYPIGVAVDAAGNVYVADNGNGTIRKITPAGMVSTLAGLAGNTGSEDGSGSAARFNFPMRLACDNAAGVIYVADTGNNTVRKITFAGVVTTVAGSPGIAGINDGTGSGALFDAPRGIAVDAAGNIYVASTNSHTIRKIRAGGIVTTLAGLAGSPGSADGVGSSVRFNSPYAVGTDSAGHVYVADTINHTVRLGLPASQALSLSIAVLSNGQKLLTGRTFPNATVHIATTTDLTVSFSPLVTVTADSTGAFQYVDAATIKRFYRASISGG